MDSSRLRTFLSPSLDAKKLRTVRSKNVAPKMRPPTNSNLRSVSSRLSRLYTRIVQNVISDLSQTCRDSEGRNSETTITSFAVVKADGWLSRLDVHRVNNVCDV